MNKPDWKDAPEWANWLAQNKDGSWMWFEIEPEPFADFLWTLQFHGGRCEPAPVYTKDWQDSLERRPKAQA